MASQRESSIPKSPESVEFLEKLQAFHDQRGTKLEIEPKLTGKYIDLLKLYNIVVERGGYDRVSDTKKAWSEIAESEFGCVPTSTSTTGFPLKTIFYNNLAAYEIVHIHGREPPPRDILEDQTAKGGSLLTRTRENYRPSRKQNADSEASGDDGTPARDRIASEETPGSSGRVTRGLRQAPPQRVLFQPETHSSRSTRAVPTSHASSPHPTQSGHHQQQYSGPRGASASNNPTKDPDNPIVHGYEPRPQMPLTLRPVITPGNNPTEFARRQKAARDAATAIKSEKYSVANKGIILPGTGFDGPNIYVRCLCALKSGIPAEQDYALHHLVKISMERGDKYRFEGFPGLAEALIEKALEVGSLFYKVDWHVTYLEDGTMAMEDSLNALDGTPNILERIQKLTKIPVDDNIQTSEFSDAILQINEAALTVRNMVMLEENAYYVSDLPPLRDWLTIALNLPKLDCLVELKHYALDIAEQLTKYYHLEETDPLYTSLLEQLHSSDRGALLTAMRAISRISMTLERNNLLKGVPVAIIQNIIDWTLLNDEEMVHSCLDVLYQYTAVVENVDFLLANVQVEPLINQLVRLLMHGSETRRQEYNIGQPIRLPAPEALAPVPQEMLMHLFKLEEPERSSVWLRCLFEEDPDEFITQIALWQAYQARFTSAAQATGIPLLAAAEFIKNVSATFLEKATAQVQPGPIQKFVIKGIRMRSVPVDPQGEEYQKCLWATHHGPCGDFFGSPESMYQHILKAHLNAVQKEDGKFENRVCDYICLWGRCQRFKTTPATKLAQIAAHIKIHLPPKPSESVKDSSDIVGPPPAKKMKPSYIIPPKKIAFTWQPTPYDERRDATGIPLSAVLVLRNLARNIPKTEAEENALKVDGEAHWMDKLFKPVEPRLFEIMVHNKTLNSYMADLLGAIKDN